MQNEPMTKLIDALSARTRFGKIMERAEKQNLRFRNDADGLLTRGFIERYDFSPQSDPKATGYTPQGEPTYLQVLDQTSEEINRDLLSDD